jgi:hypothetical protein
VYARKPSRASAHIWSFDYLVIWLWVAGRSATTNNQNRQIIKSPNNQITR